MFLLPILIPACNSSSLAFLMMCSAYRLTNRVTADCPVVLLSQSWADQWFHTGLWQAYWSSYRFLRITVFYMGQVDRKFGKLSSGKGLDWKRSVFTPIPKKGNAKECSNYHTIALISHASKVMLKILQARLQQHMNRELPYVQAGFRKGRETRSNWN